MKKSVLTLFLLPLVITSLGACEKKSSENKNPTSPELDKVELVRLLSSAEVSDSNEACLKKIKEEFVGYEWTYTSYDSDLLFYSEENTTITKVTVKGDKYAEKKAESVTKTTNGFYTYNQINTTETKYAFFGDYLLTVDETYANVNVDNKYLTFSYSARNSDSTISSLTFDVTTSATYNLRLGIAKNGKVYGVYTNQNIEKSYGHNKEGKEVTYLDKTTKEVIAEYGTLEKPQLNFFKSYVKTEKNYDNETNVFSDYKVTSLRVDYYKYSYGEIGKSTEQTDLINSLVDSYVKGVNIRYSVLRQSEDGESYTNVGSGSPDYPGPGDYGQIDYRTGQYIFSRVEVPFYQNDFVTFTNECSLVSFDKKKGTITESTVTNETVNLKTHPKFVIRTINGVKYYGLKSASREGNYAMKFVSDGKTLEVSILSNY